MVLRMGKAGALFLWVRNKLFVLGGSYIQALQTFVCLTAFFVCQTALQACSRTVYAFSRDKGIHTSCHCPLPTSQILTKRETNPCRFPGQRLLWPCFQMDPHTPTRHLAHDLPERSPRLARLCFPSRGECRIFAHSSGTRYLVHNPHRAPPHIPASPRGAIQAWTVLSRRWIAWVGGEPQLYHMGAVRFGHLLAADVSARDVKHDELCVGDHG
jgi:hypothetical protein